MQTREEIEADFKKDNFIVKYLKKKKQFIWETED